MYKYISARQFLLGASFQFRFSMAMFNLFLQLVRLIERAQISLHTAGNQRRQSCSWYLVNINNSKYTMSSRRNIQSLDIFLIVQCEGWPAAPNQFLIYCEFSDSKLVSQMSKKSVDGQLLWYSTNNITFADSLRLFKNKLTLFKL